MRAFLETQQEVMAAYLGSTHRLMPRPRRRRRSRVLTIRGSPRRQRIPRRPVDRVRGRRPPARSPARGSAKCVGWSPARRSRRSISWIAHGDPIAEHHTLGGRRVSALDPIVEGPAGPAVRRDGRDDRARRPRWSSRRGWSSPGCEQVQAHKWVRYEDVAGLPGAPRPSRRVRDDRTSGVWVGIFNRGTDGRAEAARPVFEAVAVFAGSTPAPPPAAPWDAGGRRGPADSRPSRSTASNGSSTGRRSRRWSRSGRSPTHGIDGRAARPALGAPARGRAGRRGCTPTSIVIDNFTHLLGCWGLDELADRGDVVFPLAWRSFELFGDRPPVGTDVACRIAIQEIQRHRVRVEAEIVRPDGTVWMRIRDWEDWRFHWPGRYRDVFRQPRTSSSARSCRWTIRRAGPEARPCGWRPPRTWAGPSGAMCWSRPSSARRSWPSTWPWAVPSERRSHRLWGRIAAKEAARRIWQRRRPALDLPGRPGDRRRRTRPAPS